jgi:hypothetical protein
VGRSIGWVLLAVLIVGWELAAITAASDAGMGFLEIGLLVPTGCVLAVAWGLAGVASGSGWRRPGLLTLCASFLALGAGLVAIYLSSQSPVNPLFRARFHASERALTRAAERLAAGPGHAERLRVGLFRATYATATSPEEVRFLTADCGVVDQCGLAYRPRSRPTGARYAHIAGPWYLIQEPF